MELVEGEERGDHGIIFKKVGPELRVVEGGFSSIPSQALAISNNFGLTFFLHSQGFCVASTHDLVQASQSLVDSKDEYNAMDKSLASIHLPSVQSLALSQDELIIAACTENKIQFYNVPALVQKGKEGSRKDTALLKSLPILDEKPGAKVFAWNPAQKGVILVLSKGGKLTTGPFAEQDLTEVANEVEAADWSPDGEYVCYITSDKNLHICKADLSVRSSCELPREIFSDARNDSSEACVDVLKWARVDSILINCVHMDSDGEENNSRIFVLVSSEGNFAKLQDHIKAKILSFEGFFTSIDTSIVPPDSGPYTLSTYVLPWELLIVVSRRSVDDHISLLGWFQEDGMYGVHKLELLDDRFLPRIELQACGDDNCVVGLAVDKTTTSVEIPKPNGDSGEKLRPGPVLFCMTLEGNLTLFSLARTDNKGTDIEVINNLMELPEANKVLLAYGLTCKSYGEKDTGTEVLDDKSMFSETMTQEINNGKSEETITQEINNEQSKETVTQEINREQNQETITEETNSEQVLTTRATVSVAAGPLEERKEVSFEGLQAQTGVPLKQKEASLTAQMTEQTNSEQLQKTQETVTQEINREQNQETITEETNIEQVLTTPATILVAAGPIEERKEVSFEGLQAQTGVPLKQKEASLTVQMTEQTNSEQLQRTQDTVTQEINREQNQETITEETNIEPVLTTPATVLVAAGSLEKRKEVSLEGLQAQTGVPLKQKEASLTVQMTEQTNSERLQRTFTEAQKLGQLEKRKDFTRQGLQTGAGVSLKQKEASVPVEQRNKSLFAAEKKVTSAPALSEMESEFIRELDEVKGMAMQIDNLMAVIEGKRKEKGGEAKPFFTKLLVENIESKTRNLFRQCQAFREQLMEQGRSINDLGDEILQVDYGRVYVESILEQAFDVRYQELWNKQTLHPEVAALRKRILQADQSLKQQIAELEEHLHNLELSQWHKKHHSKYSNVSSARFEDKNFRFMQSLYDTVNTQMVIAQQLAHRLAAQLEVLKLPVIPNEDMESSIDISRLQLQDMVLQEQSASDLSSRIGSRLNLFRPSDFSPIRATTKGSMQTPSKLMAGAGTRAGLQDSTRRRRDSVDKLWVDVGAAKTTVKRAAPAKRFDGISFPPNKRVLEADNKQLKYGAPHSSSIHNSGSGARNVMTNNSAFNPVQFAERPKQTRTAILEGEASVRAEDNRKPQYTDVWKVQPMPQGSTQVTAPVSINNSVSWPSTALTSTAHTDNFSASSKETSFSRTSSGRTVIQNVSITNAEKLQALATHPSLSTPSMPQDRSEPPSRTLSLSQATQMGPSRIVSTAKNTVQLKVEPVETDVEVDKMDPSKKALFSFTSQEKASTTANSFFPAPSFSDPQKKAAMGRQGQTINDTSKPEVGIIDKAYANAKANSNLAESHNVSTVGYSNKSLPGFDEQKNSSPSSMVRSLSPENLAVGPLSTGQAQSGFVSAVTSSAAIEPARQPLGSSNSVTSFSPSLFQSPNVMPTMRMVHEGSTSSEVIPVASGVLSETSGVLSETSALFNVSSMSSVKPSGFSEKGVMPAEQHSSPLTVSVSTRFVPSTVQGPPSVSDEEDMEEVGNSNNDFGSSSFAGFGLGSSSSSAGSQHSSPFGATSLWNQSSPPTSLSVPTGQLFKPASFSIPTPQLTSQTTSTLFGNNLTSGAGGPFANTSSGFGSLAQPTAAIGQSAQSGSSGQQALGNALGTFGQTRQIGSPFGVPSSPAGFGGAPSGGFASAATGGGFANATTSGGFAGVGAGGGFAGVASGGGFAGVAGGGGFSSVAAGGGFAGFSGGSISGSPNPNPSGFGGFSGGFSAFGGNTNSNIFTQMRK